MHVAALIYYVRGIALHSAPCYILGSINVSVQFVAINLVSSGECDGKEMGRNDPE